MADITNLNNFLTDVANSIRNKKGTEESIPAKNFDAEISGIPTGNVVEKVVAEASEVVEEATDVKVTSAPIGEQIVIPENGVAEVLTDKSLLAQNIGLTADKIMRGNTILNIEGTAEGGSIDISDATITEDDVLYPKIAYGKNGKLVGNITSTYVSGEDLAKIDFSITGDSANTTSTGKLMAVTQDGKYLLAPVNVDGEHGLGVFSIGDEVTLIKSYTLVYLGLSSSDILRFSLSQRIDGLRYILWYGAAGSTDVNSRIIDFANLDNPILNIRATYTASSKIMNIVAHPSIPNVCYVCRYINNYVWNIFTLRYDINDYTIASISEQAHMNSGGASTARPMHVTNDGTLMVVSGAYVSNERPYDAYLKKYDTSGVFSSQIQVNKSGGDTGISADGSCCIIGGTLYKLGNNGTTYTLIGNTGLTTMTEYGYSFLNDKYVVTVTSVNELKIDELDLETGSVIKNVYTGVISAMINNVTNQNAVYALNNSKSTLIRIGVEQTDIIASLTRKNKTYYDTLDTTGDASNVLDGYTVYANGSKIEGAMTNNGELTYTPSDVPQRIPSGYTSGGTINPVNITSLSDYTACLNITDAILGTADLIPILNGLVLDLEANSDNVTNSDGVIWTDNINSKQISINNGSVDTDNSIIFNGANTSFDSGITQEKLKNGYTVITRIRPTEWGNYKGVFGLHGSAGLVGLQYQAGLIHYSHLPIKTYITISPDVLSTNTWHTVACSYYGTAGKIYVDGELVASGKLDTLSPLGNLIFGYCYNDTDRYFKGNISHCIVYNRELSDLEIKTVNDYIEDTTIGKKLKYVQSDGSQYIDTGVKSASDIEFEIKFNHFGYNTSSGHSVILGARNGYSNKAFMFFNLLSNSTNKKGVWIGNQEDMISTTYTHYGVDAIASFKNAVFSLTSEQGVETHDITIPSVFTGSYNMVLFASRLGSGTIELPAYMKLYYCKIWKAGELVRDFIPYLDLNGVICLYDKVSKTHFYNQGTGDFIGGGVQWLQN